jgi:hypothetical protein
MHILDDSKLSWCELRIHIDLIAKSDLLKTAKSESYLNYEIMGKESIFESIRTSNVFTLINIMDPVSVRKT